MGSGNDHGDASAPPARFRAFVSYAHADARHARRLQRRLEAYRIPSRLRSRAPTGPHGGVGRIFRDREDLPAGPDLSAAVKAALSQSQALIVVCSRATPGSLWVAREIELFRSLHPDRPVLAALVDGAPENAFPEALTAGGVEPLAADFRRDADGPRLAFLKVAAGVLGISLDELIQRDAQRRLRSVMAVTVVALAAVLTLSAMTTLAIQSRNRAERQRAEAEGLIEFMLTDLRQSLRSVGRLDVMTDVNERAMRYYEAQSDLGRLPDQSLERRARVIGEMGEDEENRGNLDEAREHYEELHRTTAALLIKHPSDPQRIFGHANSENRLALIAFNTGRYDEALEHLAASWRLMSDIEDWGRDRAEWMRLAGYVRGNFCGATLMRGLSPADALEHCAQAVTLNEGLMAKLPDDLGARYDLVFHNLWLAEAAFAAGVPDRARGAQARYLEVMRALIADDPQNMLLREQQMELYVRHAELLAEYGDPDEGRPFLEEARTVSAALVNRDPTNAIWSDYDRRLSDLFKGSQTDEPN